MLELNEGVDQYLLKAKELVALTYGVPTSDIYIVWFSKTLQNWKALLSATADDGLYFEVTYNGDKAESYVDTYRKISNIKISDTIK